ncbi:Nucleoporin nup57 [Tritrichomonas musculus]|uniref:Nucleoporin nup57 n=1 Tax=Tritrichomonas musculus TaxID=1915356 RepID=A0ABR2JV44_9EUKA
MTALQRSPGVNFTEIGANSGAKSSSSTSTSKTTSGFGSGFGGFSFGQTKASDKPVDPLIQRLNQIRDSIKPPTGSTGFSFGQTTNNSQADEYKFSSIVLNIAGQSAPAKPASFTQENWDKEISKAKQYPMVNESLAPSVISGFKSLEERFDKQNEIVEKMKKKLISMKLDIERIRQRYDDEFIDLIQDISKNNREISEKLMEFLQKKEKSHDLAFSPQESELFDKLQKLESEIDKPNKFKSALNALNLKAMMIRESTPVYPDIKITNKTEEAEAIIKSNHDAITSLVNVISQTQKTTTILEKAYQDKIQTYINSFNSYT